MWSVMTAPVHTIGSARTLREAHDMLEQLEVSALCVVDDHEKPVGVLSRTDLVSSARPRALDRHMLDLPRALVGDLMQRDVATLDGSEPLSQAAGVVVNRGVHRVFVTEAGRVVGVVSTREIMEVLVAQRVRTPLASLMTRSMLSVGPRDPVRVAVDRLAATRKRALPVMVDNVAIGWFSQYEALLFRESPSESPVEDWMDPRVLTLPETMPAHRAAAHALTVCAQRLLALDDYGVTGIVTGTDVASALAP